MIKNNSKPENKVLKKIKKVALIIFLVILGLIVYVAVDNMIIANTHKARFVDLDTEMSTIYNRLVTASGGVDEWNYNKRCLSKSEFGDWAGDYVCETYINMKQPVTNIDEILVMNEKYTDILKSNKNLTPTSGRGPSLLPNTFETGGYDGMYNYKNDGIICDFDSTLLEKKMIGDINDLLWPDKLPDDKNGLVNISISCRGDTVDDWYEAI